MLCLRTRGPNRTVGKGASALLETPFAIGRVAPALPETPFAIGRVAPALPETPFAIGRVAPALPGTPFAIGRVAPALPGTPFAIGRNSRHASARKDLCVQLREQHNAAPGAGLSFTLVDVAGYMSIECAARVGALPYDMSGSETVRFP
ncbi:ABC-type metal ion transport system, permease component [Methylocaldum marinum]|uniref:ABC-type metal ion transport system, permease component n=1 Tax=Methylocaldum marinum TaxID=1432792 RepID=A0A250KPX1_9GAMM|nr:ABC-type metal ion transport system, permease component [Methylocaldum marinum]